MSLEKRNCALNDSIPCTDDSDKIRGLLEETRRLKDVVQAAIKVESSETVLNYKCFRIVNIKTH